MDNSTPEIAELRYLRIITWDTLQDRLFDLQEASWSDLDALIHLLACVTEAAEAVRQLDTLIERQSSL